MKQGSHLSCFFQTRKAWRTSAPCFSNGKAWRTSAPCFSNRKSMAHQCAAIFTHAPVRKKAVAESSSATADIPCPICVLRRPRTTKSSGSCSRARQRTCQKRPARLPAFSWTPAHNGRLSAQSRAAANTATGKPRILTGFLLIPPPRSAAARGTMIRVCFYMYKIPRRAPIVNAFFLPSAFFCNRPPKNPHRKPPPVPSTGGWVRVWAPPV